MFISTETSIEIEVARNEDNGEFDVKQVRRLFDIELDSSYNSFKWVNLILIKVNCFVWRLIKDSIPTFADISKRGASVSPAT